ncbi:GNAT family N-acetyltransferase [Elizabethkingia anophelis]|uniref:GNAT family N-acetyltransferase n=1 Tax=Elizabethkingia anophelis TaxID=1117645 RepID=UPI0008409413|nr:GNAT family N-acetyltransferase [Elizabethkingia anophelis]MCT3803551.1 GNAT family N-acetyltransferase [Elizabethkingia anophelis]MCT3905423.1 GNAT family N-acetyltransferase [Elizabethkingia anophelis]MCT4060398.1 GNAT family N-acetyltransferase [Elizabethkingia anophelis]MCT4071020.1 GNAT family N-acetyltransferase [Elizabethkingia anophelis]MCT4120384.1 GNAT family N-acetyltransferase [Elizabethkingia anophelis]
MIHTEQLILTEPNQDDFGRYFNINADPQNNLYNPGGPMKYEAAISNFENIIRHWQEHKFGVWSIAEKKNPKNVIGFGGLNYKKYANHLRLNLGYRFDKDFWGKGYATELAIMAIKFGFNELDKNEIYALVRPSNLSSIRVLEKSGLELFSELNDVENEVNSLVFRIENNPIKDSLLF